MTWIAVACGYPPPEGAVLAVDLQHCVARRQWFYHEPDIEMLTFPPSPALQDRGKLGVLIGSIASALVGAAILLVARRARR